MKISFILASAIKEEAKKENKMTFLPTTGKWTGAPPSLTVRGVLGELTSFTCGRGIVSLSQALTVVVTISMVTIAHCFRVHGNPGFS